MTVSTSSQLQDNLSAVRGRIAEACRRAGRATGSVCLVAVTKSFAVDVARRLVDLGQTELGESRPQELWEKADQLPADVRWHMIGHLQTNKARRTLPIVSMLHSLDRWSLAETISAESTRTKQTMPVTLEVNLTGEPSKHGFEVAQVRSAYGKLCQLPGLEIVGLMTLARLEAEPERCRPTFAALRELRDRLVAEHPAGPALDVLSMGMSQDFEVAIEEGATHVRIGTALFEGLTR